MPGAERQRPRPAAGDGVGGGREERNTDIDLGFQERLSFLHAVANAYRSEAAAATVLNQIQFPAAQRPTWQGLTPEQWWGQIFAEFDNGLIPTPYFRLLDAAIRVYQANREFRRIAVRHRLIPAGPGDAPPPPEVPEQPDEPVVETPAEQAAAPTCHVIVRADSEEQRARAAAVLAERGLAPHEVWSTARAVSYRVSATDSGWVRQRLDATDLGWTVVPPGEPDYLFQSLFVQGPDGRQFRLVDAPAQQTVGNVASEVMDQYPEGFIDPRRPAVIDQVQPDGSGRRLDPDDTLHNAQVRDGDRLRVAAQRTAGAVNPLARQDALFRVRNQVVAYAEAHPGFAVRANSTLQPTEYELEFIQRSFAASPDRAGEPIDVDKHILLLQLGPNFPETPPLVFWQTSIFHPNVYPNYDSEQARDNPLQSGLVCLGVLAESYQPSMDFGELCQTLVDMAAFRNYSLFEPTGALDANGEPEVHGNFYDLAAAKWVVTNQDRIEAMGGRVLFRPAGGRPSYRNVIEDVDGG